MSKTEEFIVEFFTCTESLSRRLKEGLEGQKKDKVRMYQRSKHSVVLLVRLAGVPVTFYRHVDLIQPPTESGL